MKKGRKFYIFDIFKIWEFKRFLNFIVFLERFKGFKEDWMFGFGVYGSFVFGENREDSDIDVWVFVRKEELLKFVRLKRKIFELMDREVDLIVLMLLRLLRF